MNTNRVPAEVGLEQASELVSRALAIDPDFPLAIFVRGLVAGSRGRLEQALPDLYRAHELWPGDANILVELCRFANTAGLREHGVLVERCVEVDPLTPVTSLVVSTYHTVNGRNAQAAPAARRAIEMAPSASMLHVLAAWEIAEAGFMEEACGILGRVGAEIPGTPPGSWALFLKDAGEGNRDQALARLTPELEPALTGNEFSARMVAQGLALLDRPDDAFRWLRISIDLGFINYPYLVEHDAFLRRLKDDLRFQGLLEEVRPRWEAVVEWERSR